MEAKTSKHNLEDIADTVPGGDHPRVHHFVSNGTWGDAIVLDWVSREADGRLGGMPDSHLLVDESAMSKKGDDSVGVGRQSNGRLGKVDHCQVGVFAALAADYQIALLEGRLYLPQEWCDDPARCAAAKIPEKDRVFKTKTQLALELVRTQRARGVRRRQIDIDSKKRRNPPILEDDL